MFLFADVFSFRGPQLAKRLSMAPLCVPSENVMFCTFTIPFSIDRFAMQSEESLVLEETEVEPSESLSFLFNPVKHYIS